MTVAQFPTVTVEYAGVTNASTFNWITFYTSTGPAAQSFDTGVFPGTSWIDISSDLRAFSTRRGRQRAQDRFAPGTCTIELDETSGNNWSSTLAPNTRMRIRATWNGVTYPVYDGYVDAAVAQFSPGQHSYTTTVVTLTDGFKPLQQFQPAAALSIGGAGEDSGARINRILDNASWPAGARQIDTGTESVQALAFTNTALDEMQTVADSEQGRLYMTADGRVRFENRQYRQTNTTSNVSQIYLADAYSFSPDELYQTVVRSHDDTLVRNTISAQIMGGGVLQTATDATSVAQNYTRSYNSTSLLLTSDAAANNWAQWQLLWNKNADERYDSLVLRPLGNPTVLWPEVLGRMISDQVQVSASKPNTLTLFAFVEGVDHTVTTAPQDWSTSYWLSNNAPVNNGITFLLFDDATAGKFNVDAFA